MSLSFGFVRNMAKAQLSGISWQGLQKSLLHTSPPLLYPGEIWRKRRGMPKNPNAYGPLTDGPDYSFIDGRPVPPGAGKLMRAREQREVAEKILRLSGEVDFAVQRHKDMEQTNQQLKLAKIDRKLKEKGRIPPEVRN